MLLVLVSFRKKFEKQCIDGIRFLALGVVLVLAVLLGPLLGRLLLILLLRDAQVGLELLGQVGLQVLAGDAVGVTQVLHCNE